MGFAEDDRIRTKNRLYDQAYLEYEEMRGRGLTNLDIVAFVAGATMSPAVDDETKIRNDILATILKIVERNHGEKSN